MIASQGNGKGSHSAELRLDCHEGTDWLHIMDGESGFGPGVITYSLEPNSTPEKRVGGSTFGGKTFTVTQKGSTLP